MAEPGPTPRQRIVAGAADMIRRRGLNATSIREVARHAQTPLGSTYHYFPGGKQQLAVEAVRLTGDTVAAMLRAMLRAGPVDGLRAFLALWREILTSTDFQAGCPVLAVSIEEPADDTRPAIVAAAAEVFGGWETQLAEAMRLHGADPATAASLATLVIAAIEGAVAMCRAQRTTRPLDRVAAQLETLVAAAVGN
ncbi:TetR/AcrR family transcriptional regulator [Frankia sp. CNm7]|uniref:TetR/AcrR family transcriptional regulator n=1 Tax=Frankia nepalensis TaxID=1836974 RepID=A0A937RJD3_9ACTN|nr:TetR family transcriptional regulator [Frankia nepalensis]MBL7500830.1 TetR/AcrR family transcriptional regulator [Frankia nepalensis]MBL7515311.1 TetR/AcrR family transcriptional regulator [Frankia nepalensis]MBL7522276.1 TetR/AcrR family transcriptional regulator [Frankia nepalensis]MBL7627041.1 TetR/AcrR family transcriptional regulator [Frankia nepalensis]